MDGYDQLWSLVEAGQADIVPGLVDELTRATGAGDRLSADFQLDLPAVEDLPDNAPFHADFLMGPTPADDFFPVHGFDALASVAFAPTVPETVEPPLVRPTAPDSGLETVEPLVLPGLLADEFVIPREQGGPRVRAETPHNLQLVDPADNLPDWFLQDGHYDLPIDHTLHAGAHGLIGAHGTDDWLL